MYLSSVNFRCSLFIVVSCIACDWLIRVVLSCCVLLVIKVLYEPKTQLCTLILVKFAAGDDLEPLI
jgi:hypothetical protein